MKTASILFMAAIISGLAISNISNAQESGGGVSGNGIHSRIKLSFQFGEKLNCGLGVTLVCQDPQGCKLSTNEPGPCSSVHQLIQAGSNSK